MSTEPAIRRWKLKPREMRMLIYLLIVLGVVAWKYVPRPWNPSIVFEAPHHLIYSTATRPQTEATARALEVLYCAYSNRFGHLETFQRDPPQLKVKLFKNRTEMRKINPGMGWAEAFYRAPYCWAYYSGEEINPYHWMLHECAHQLNNEVAHVELSQWIEEGLAEYFSTSRMGTNELAVGRIDPNTYPVWWIDELATASELAENIRNGSVIPLRSIITNRGGPRMKTHFNLYYLHWWTLTYFLFESAQYRDKAVLLVQRGGDLEAFEKIIGPVEEVQTEWHKYVRRLKAALDGKDLEFFQRQPKPKSDN